MLQSDSPPLRTVPRVSSFASEGKVGLMSRRSKALALAALVAALAAFQGLPWLVLVYPALLSHSLVGLTGRAKVALSSAWGVLFSLGFYHWVGAYGVLPWIALGLARGLPWALYPLPELLWRRWRGEGEPQESRSLDLTAILGGAVGLGLVSQALLLGITGVDWETPAALLTAWPWLLWPLPALGLAVMASVLGLVGHLLLSARRVPTLIGLALLPCWWFVTSALWESTGQRPPLKVALLQTGFAQDEKWDQDRRVQGVDKLLEETSKAAKMGAELVIWPETAWPYRGMRRRVTNTRRIGKVARNLKIDILASSIEEVPERDDPDWLNSVSLVLSSGRFTEHYEKRRLAPFAEYLPLPQSWQKPVRSVEPFSWISRYTPGQQPTVFRTTSGHRFAVLICYESMTPSMASEMASEVDFLVVVSNDAPFRSSQANEAHFRSAILRSIETGRPVVQAANTGVTGAIASNGEVLIRTPVGFSGPNVQYLSP